MNKKFLLLSFCRQRNEKHARMRVPIMFRLQSLILMLILIAKSTFHAYSAAATSNNYPSANIFLSVNKKDILVSGTVKDKSGESIPGTTVRIKGTTKAVTANDKGQFAINVPSTESVLVFTFIGYKPLEVTVGNQTTINVTLQESSTNLNEVVIVNMGYGSVSRERLAGAVSSVTSKDVADFPVSSIAEALEGKLAGVSVTSTEGAPGAAINVVVRGGTSITQDNSPLYIVDGVPMDNALNILSPQEIQSIDVLKDVASTSIYGSRGANGVVIITTKNGRKGRTTVSFDTYAGARKITDYLEMMKPYEYVQAQLSQNLMHYNGFLITDTAAINGFYKTYGSAADLGIYKGIPAVNWQQRVFGRSAFSNTQNLNISGGSDQSNFSIIFNRYDEQGIMLASGLDRVFGSVRYENQLGKSVRMGLNARYSNQLILGSGTSSKGTNGSIINAARFQPYDATSNLQLNDPNANFDTAVELSTPTDFATRDMAQALARQFIGSGFLNITFAPGLTFRSTIGYNVGQNTNKSFRGVVNYAVTSYSNLSLYAGYPYVDLGISNSTTINNSNVLSFSKNIKANNRLDITLG